MRRAEFKFCLLTMEKRSSVLQRELSLSKNLYRYQKWDVEYCLLCWFCIVQNFWQATKASLLWGVAPNRD